MEKNAHKKKNHEIWNELILRDIVKLQIHERTLNGEKQKPLSFRILFEC